MKKVSRRELFKEGAKVVGGGIVVTLLGSVLPGVQNLARASEGGRWTDLWENYEWAFVVDTNKCIGCGRCVRACKLENGVPLDKEVFRTWVERYAIHGDEKVLVDSPDGGLEGFHRETQGDATKSFFVPKLCNQCKKPPCVRVCPVGATYKTKDGVVLVDRKRCIGCGYCVQSCPYGARFIHPELRVADKCTWCYHRITKGLMPACVQSCPVGARAFGNIKDKNSPVREIIETQRVNVLKHAMGTEPVVYYLGLDKVVV